MHYWSNLSRFLPVTAAAVAIWVVGIGAISLAAEGAGASKSTSVKARCPSSVTGGRKVTPSCFADCPRDLRALQGGNADLGTNATQNGQQRQVTVSFNGPSGAGTGWSAQLLNDSTSIDLEAYAICATAG
jgi:hypothetical protein